MNKDLSIKGMIKTLFDMIEKVEEEYYNGNVFEVAIYLYMRYGEIPLELDDDKILEKVQNIIKNKDTLFNEEINNKIENLILERKDKDELL